MKEIKCPVKIFSIKTPNDTALVDGEEEISYFELNNRIDAVIHSLRKLNINRGMRVGVISENSIQYVILIFSILRLGGIVVPINFRFGFLEIERIVSGMEIDLIISDMFGEDFSVSKINVCKFNDLAFRKTKQGIQKTENYFGDGKTIILTSGSTGIPKGVLLSVENHYYNAIGSNMNIALEKKDRWLLALPLFHVGGLAILFRVFIAGATVSLYSQKNGSIGKKIDKGGITHVSMVFTQIDRYVAYLKDKNPPEKLKAVLAGGSNIPVPLVKKCLDLKIPIYKTYGLTEMSSQVTTTDKVVNNLNLSTSGPVLKYRELSIGQENEIYVRGKTLFSGYISDRNFFPVSTDNNGWFNTGDIGFINNSGELFVTGRKDNMFISGGENIFPEEIEAVLVDIAFINDAVVIAVNNKKYGKRPVAFINCNKKVSLKEIYRKLLYVLPKFKIPDRFYVLEEIETSGIKRDRHRLIKMVENGEAIEFL